MLAASEIKKMSLAERLRAMELLWKYLSGSPKGMDSPEWHGDVLSDRAAKVDAGKGNFLTLSQVKKRLGKRS